jgi:3-hydroxyacyl-[acyl-carrier-protein] dehydratase
MQRVMNVEEIQKYLPHRYPFLLVDFVSSVTESQIVAVKNVTINEPHFVGHFPAKPVMPGVLIVEALAQAAGVLMGKILEKETEILPNNDALMYFMSMDGVKFRNMVIPGDQLVLEVTLTQQRGKIAKFKGVAKVQEKVVTEASFMAMLG